MGSSGITRVFRAIISEDLWWSIVGWRALFRWDVLGALVPGVFLASGVGLMGIDWFPHNLFISQLCFGICGALCVVKTIGHAIQHEASTKGPKVVFCLLICGAIVGINVYVVRAIQTHKGEAQAKSAEQPFSAPTHRDDDIKSGQPTHPPDHTVQQQVDSGGESHVRSAQKEAHTPQRESGEPRVEFREWTPPQSIENRRYFDIPHVNKGTGVAYDEVGSYKIAVLPASQMSEDGLFYYLYTREDDKDAERRDQPPGDENIVHSTIHYDVPSAEDSEALRNGTKRMYVGLLITYFDELRRKYRSESCWYFAIGNSGMASCTAHNRFYRVGKSGSARAISSSSVPVVDAPNGIAIGRDNYGNPSVINNYGPPPPHLEFTQEDVKLPGGDHAAKVTVTVDRQINKPVLVTCDRPCYLEEIGNGTIGMSILIKSTTVSPTQFMPIYANPMGPGSFYLFVAPTQNGGLPHVTSVEITKDSTQE